MVPFIVARQAISLTRTNISYIYRVYLEFLCFAIHLSISTLFLNCQNCQDLPFAYPDPMGKSVASRKNPDMPNAGNSTLEFGDFPYFPQILKLISSWKNLFFFHVLPDFCILLPYFPIVFLKGPVPGRVAETTTAAQWGAWWLAPMQRRHWRREGWWWNRKWWCNGDWMGIYWDLTGYYRDLMGFFDYLMINLMEWI